MNQFISILFKGYSVYFFPGNPAAAAIIEVARSSLLKEYLRGIVYTFSQKSRRRGFDTAADANKVVSKVVSKIFKEYVIYLFSPGNPAAAAEIKVALSRRRRH